MHQDPKSLGLIYSKINKLCSKYIYLSEYFNPTLLKFLIEVREKCFIREILQRNFGTSIKNLN